MQPTCPVPKRRRVSRHHAQGFAVGIGTSILASLLYDVLKAALA